jgi:hypothetical protein
MTGLACVYDKWLDGAFYVVSPCVWFYFDV